MSCPRLAHLATLACHVTSTHMHRSGGRRQQAQARRRQAKQARKEFLAAQRKAAKAAAAAAAEERERREQEAQDALAARGVDVTGDSQWAQRVAQVEADRAARGADAAARRGLLLDVLTRSPGLATLAAHLATAGPVTQGELLAELDIGDEEWAGVLDALHRAGHHVVSNSRGQVAVLPPGALESLTRAVTEAGSLDTTAAAAALGQPAPGHGSLRGLSQAILVAGGAVVG